MRAQPTNQHAARGFSLLELLVVIVIVAILLGMVALRIGNTGGDDLVEDAARQLRALIDLAAEEAVLQGQTYGLQFERENYLFVRYEPDQRVWTPIQDDAVFRQRQLHEDVEVELFVEAQEVTLEVAETDKPAAGELGAPPPQPQIVFLSSGEMTPFELLVSSDVTDLEVRLVGEPLGNVTTSHERP